MRRESNFILTWNLQKFEKSFQISPLLGRSCQSLSRPVWRSFEPTSPLSVSVGRPLRACSCQCRRHRLIPAVGFLTLECLGGNRVLRASLHHVLPIFLSQLLFKVTCRFLQAFLFVTSVSKGRPLDWAQYCGADLSSFEKKKAVAPLTLMKLC